MFHTDYHDFSVETGCLKNHPDQDLNTEIIYQDDSVISLTFSFDFYTLNKIDYYDIYVVNSNDYVNYYDSLQTLDNNDFIHIDITEIKSAKT